MRRKTSSFVLSKIFPQNWAKHKYASGILDYAMCNKTERVL